MGHAFYTGQILNFDRFSGYSFKSLHR